MSKIPSHHHPQRRRRQRNNGRQRCKSRCIWMIVMVLSVLFSVFCVHLLIDSMKVNTKQPASLLSTHNKNKIRATTQQQEQSHLSTEVKVPIEQQQQRLPLPHHLSDEAIAMCRNTLYHTLSSTTLVLPNAETFIYTGDIDDLWLRDSAAQVHPYLVSLDSNAPTRSSLLTQDPVIERVVSGLIQRHALYIHHDPYANAFRIDDTYVFSAAQKKLGRHDLISTWNYELDSGCYTIRLLYHYWKQTSLPHDQTVLVTNPAVKRAVSIMLKVWTAEQKHEDDSIAPDLDCQNCGKPYRYPGLPRNGKGSPTNATAGLTWSAFRPSDDAQQYGYLIPSNMMCITVLGYVQEMAASELLWNDAALVQQAAQLQSALQLGIEQHAIIQHPKYGPIYAYEVDGLGNYNLMDDANVPSLLSVPYLEYPYLNRTIYENTRRFVLSPDNPTYSSGTNSLTGPISGIGSPHMQQRIRHNVWPMALAIQGLTAGADHAEEQVHLAEQLVKLSASTNFMHESVSVTNPHQFTRPWFCWADALYAEFVLRLLGKDSEQCWGQEYTIKEWRDKSTTMKQLRATKAAASSR